MNDLIENLVHIPVDSFELDGVLKIPNNAKGIVVFAHGSGSSRFSPRNNFVANILHKNGFATLLFDLLTETEDTVYQNRFDIPLLAKRLVAVTQWLMKQPHASALNIGFFGASTGSAAALIASTELGGKINAIVSRGGRPDLAEEALKLVKSPTLLIVGGFDYDVIELNEKAAKLISAVKKTSIVPGATHLFEEPGALEEVAKLATEWFTKYLTDDAHKYAP